MGFAIVFGAGGELAEALADVVGFEVDAVDLVIGATTFDGGPFDDVAGGSAHGIAKVGLLVDFLGAGAGAAVGEELGGGEVGALAAVNDVEEAEFDGVGHGDAEVEVPGAGRIFDFRLLILD